MAQLYACIDGSPVAPAVCDHAAWAAARLDAPITLLHVLEDAQYPLPTDISGHIGLGARDQLLNELAQLDAQRNTLALAQGRQLLAAAQARLQPQHDPARITLRQRHGRLVDSLAEVADDIRLLVIGRQGEQSSAREQIGSQLETVIRTLHRPTLVVPAAFRPLSSALLAYDGSENSRLGVRLMAASPLFEGLSLHVVMVGADTPDHRAQLQWAEDALRHAGRPVHAVLRAGEIEPTLHAYQQDHQVDLLVMGAYGHSRLREFFVGSTTTRMLQTTPTPLLLLR